MKRRSYDSTGRLHRARASRERVLDAARAVFEERGYAQTTIGAIAAKAGVSVETIYKAFGGKPGLVKALHAKALEGAGPTPAEQRSDAMSGSAATGRAVVEGWGKLMKEVAPRVSPIVLLVRAAAEEDAALAELLRDIDEQRLARMRQNARVLEARGFLREGTSVAEAGEIMWALTSPELYELFVVRRGWSMGRLATFATQALAASLLRD